MKPAMPSKEGGAKSMNYYGIVRMGRKYALVYATKLQGEPTKVSPTGQSFNTWDAAVKAMNAQNAALGIGLKR